MKAKGGRLLDHSIAPYPGPLATLLVLPDRLIFDLTEHTHAHHSEIHTHTNMLISGANPSPFSFWGNCMCNWVMCMSKMKVNQLNPSPPLPPPPLCLDGSLMKVQQAISSSRNLVITVKAMFKIPLITA